MLPSPPRINARRRGESCALFKLPSSTIYQRRPPPLTLPLRHFRTSRAESCTKFPFNTMKRRNSRKRNPPSRKSCKISSGNVYPPRRFSRARLPGGISRGRTIVFISDYPLDCFSIELARYKRTRCAQASNVGPSCFSNAARP